jgi:MFS transporter, ACS family, glucarate transporter
MDAAVTTATTTATRVRYIVLLLTVAAYMITYIDRVLLSAAVPSIESEFGFSTITMGWVLSSYQIAYAAFQIPGGWLGDKLGARVALTAVVIWWSLFTALTALTWSAVSMALCLFLFGMGEAGAFPIATRSLSRWMLPGERGIAQGATHAGSRLGGALTPIMAVFLISQWGWRSPFFCFAGLGVAWALIWYGYYRDTPREHPRVNQPELQRIEQALGNPAARRSVPWGRIVRSPQMWLLSAMYFCYGYDIGMFLSWFPKYLHAARGFNLQQMGLYASLPLFAGFAGDLCGGAFSDWLLRRSGNLKLARRAVGLFGFLLTAVMIPLACLPADPWVSVVYFCGAVFGLELTVGVSWAITLDLGGDYAGSVSAVMNTLGNLGAAAAAALTGYIATEFGWSYAFLVLAVLALIAAVLCSQVDASRKLDLDAPLVEAQ